MGLVRDFTDSFRLPFYQTELLGRSVSSSFGALHRVLVIVGLVWWLGLLRTVLPLASKAFSASPLARAPPTGSTLEWAVSLTSHTSLVVNSSAVELPDGTKLDGDLQLTWHVGNSTLELNRPLPWVILQSPFEQQPFLAFEKDEELEAKAHRSLREWNQSAGPLVILTERRLFVRKPWFALRLGRDEEEDEEEVPLAKLKSGIEEEEEEDEDEDEEGKSIFGDDEEEIDQEKEDAIAARDPLNYFYFQTALKDVHQLVKESQKEVQEKEKRERKETREREYLEGKDDSSQFLAYSAGYVVPYVATYSQNATFTPEDIGKLLADFRSLTKFLFVAGVILVLFWTELVVFMTVYVNLLTVTVISFLISRPFQSTSGIPFLRFMQINAHLAIPFSILVYLFPDFSHFTVIQVSISFYLLREAWIAHQNERIE